MNMKQYKTKAARNHKRRHAVMCQIEKLSKKASPITNKLQGLKVKLESLNRESHAIEHEADRYLRK
jgi:septal ring factor EnvC (AmiA/AmiB activator)